jgi:hypothetical protein
MGFGTARWLRALAVVAAVVAGFAGLAWLTVRGQTACEVCVVYRGRQACREASAATADEARQHAQATACALVTNGVTQDLECQRTEPTRLRCE